jgi:prolipoprotein diacylglyceryl transferase
VIPAFIPSPDQGVWNIGPLPIRAYALLIVAGIVVAVWWGNRRYLARGGNPGTITDIAIWAVPFGIIGGRLYHVITDNQLYFGPGKNPMDAFLIWEGGLGIWGAVALGALGAWIGARRSGVLLPPVADAIAPGIVAAQAIGRLGNYFNQELFGAPTTVPWGLEIDLANRPAGYEEFSTFHPTFLYESLWLVALAILLVWADRRFTMGHGRVFALYVLGYCTGRLWIELLRVDSANTILGLRVNVWTSILVGIGALVYLVVSARTRPGRETVLTRSPEPGAEPGADPQPEHGEESASASAPESERGPDPGPDDRAEPVVG